MTDRASRVKAVLAIDEALERLRVGDVGERPTAVLREALIDFEDEEFARKNGGLLDLIIVILSTTRDQTTKDIFEQAVRLRLKAL